MSKQKINEWFAPWPGYLEGCLAVWVQQPYGHICDMRATKNFLNDWLRFEKHSSSFLVIVPFDPAIESQPHMAIFSEDEFKVLI